jgi:hypothetical protein
VDAERIQILIEIRRAVGGRDPDLDSIIYDAINGEEEPVLMDRLARVAERKSLARRVIDDLNRHSGTIVSWLVEVGFQIADHAVS